MSNTEYRAVIKFVTRKGLSATQITKELTDAYGDSAPSCRTIAKWVAEFEDSTRVFKDASRGDRPTTAVADESIRAVEDIVMRDRHISVRRVAGELSISKTSLYKIISGHLGMKEVCTKWVPKLLTPLQRANQVDCCEELLENGNQDLTGFFGRIETKDEAWIYHY